MECKDVHTGLLLWPYLRGSKFPSQTSAVVSTTALITTLVCFFSKPILEKIERLSPRKCQEISEERLSAKGHSHLKREEITYPSPPILVIFRRKSTEFRLGGFHFKISSHRPGLYFWGKWKSNLIMLIGVCCFSELQFSISACISCPKWTTILSHRNDTFRCHGGGCASLLYLLLPLQSA